MVDMKSVVLKKLHINYKAGWNVSQVGSNGSLYSETKSETFMIEKNVKNNKTSKLMLKV